MISEGMVALPNNRSVLLDERIFGAYRVWASAAFQCLTGDELFNHASQALCLQLIVVGVGVKDELSWPYVQLMMTQFCTTNWPQFTTLSNEKLAKGEKLTVTNFLRFHASKLEVNSKSLLLLADSSKKKKRKNVSGNCVKNAYKKVICFEV